jgi:hypothetical protein
MKRVFVSDSLAETGHLKTMLEQQGIGCFVKNEQLLGAMGDVPFLECAPEIWVYNDAEAAAARSIIDDLTAPGETHDPWRCQACGENNEGQYAACWQCGASDGRE